MLDKALRKIIAKPTNRIGAFLAGLGISANIVSFFGLFVGLAASISVAAGWFLLALFLIIISRIADGLDGAVARATKSSDFGGYLDIVADFFFYGAIVLGFIINNPGTNSIIGAILLLSFYVNGASFLGYAILAQKYEIEEKEKRSFYFSEGLIEGSETIFFFIIICIWPDIFVPFAAIFALLCFITAIMRVVHARKIFTE